MNVSEMSDHQKTLLIIGLIPNWNTWGYGSDGDDIILQVDQKGSACLQRPYYLYSEKWMFLAWRVGCWAGDNLPNVAIMALNDFWLRKDTYPYDIFMWYEPDAQRAWLDKILELAVVAGMVKE